MSRTMHLALTDELQAFIEKNCGDGTLYSTPGEFVRQVLREKKDLLDAAQIREAILEGYQDAIHGRTVAYHGNLKQLMKKVDE